MTRLAYRPLEDRPSDVWTDPVNREYSPFRSGWDETTTLLLREVRLIERVGLYESVVVLEVDVPDGMVREDGQLHRQAIVRSPRIAVNIDSVHGALRYTCDRFESGNRGSRDGWRVNVRAVALGLEALRKVERYGIISRAGQQYTGWAQLGSGIPMGAASGPMTFERARQLLTVDGEGTPSEVRAAYHAAVKAHHPDADGDGDGSALRLLAEARDRLIGATT